MVILLRVDAWNSNETECKRNEINDIYLFLIGLFFHGMDA